MKRLLFVVGLLFLLAPTSPAQATTQHVAIQDYAYGPATLTIQVGDTVEWINHDQASHNVVTTSAPVAFQSPMLATGQTWSFTFTVPGTYSYYCSVHPDMRAQIIVQPAPETPAPTPAPAPEQAAPPAQQAPTETAAPAAPPATTAAPPTTTTGTMAPAQQTTQTAQATMTESLNPMLLVSGLVAAVTIICLLLMNAKPE
jgi:plastocyanin